MAKTAIDLSEPVISLVENDTLRKVSQFIPPTDDRPFVRFTGLLSLFKKLVFISIDGNGEPDAEYANEFAHTKLLKNNRQIMINNFLINFATSLPY